MTQRENIQDLRNQTRHAFKNFMKSRTSENLEAYNITRAKRNNAIKNFTL